MEPIFAAQNKIKANLGLHKIPVIANSNYKRHGTKSYVYLLNRFGFNPTLPGPYYHVSQFNQAGKTAIKEAIGGRVRHDRVLMKKATAADAKPGQVTADDIQNDSMYLCEVSIGTPGQKLKLDFDTGSADLWVFSTELGKSTGSGHNVFDPKKSSTYKKLSKAAWKIQYGDGSTASGDCGEDTLNIGGLTVEKQTIELASKLSDQFTQSSGDGLLGLAFSTINTVTTNGTEDPQATPVENMIAQKDIPKEAELFTSAFYSDRDAKAPESFYTFGYIDQSLVGDQEIQWTDIDNSQGFWQVPSESYSINGKSANVSGNTAIVDTGTTLALVSDEVCKALYDAIPNATYDSTNQGYVFPENTAANDLPDFKVAVGDQKYTINKADLAFASLQDGSGMVYGSVQSRGTMDFDILGDAFLKSIYAIWDQGNKRFGAVPKN